jgi:hypothetical protein
MMCNSPTIGCLNPKCNRGLCGGGFGACPQCEAEAEVAYKMLEDKTYPPLETIPGYLTREADEARWRDDNQPEWREPNAWHHSLQGRMTSLSERFPKVE